MTCEPDNQLGMEVSQPVTPTQQEEEPQLIASEESAAPPTPAASGAGSVDSEGPKAVEQFDWSELRKLGNQQYCAQCKKVALDAAPQSVVRKKCHGKWVCRTCHNVTTMLYKRCNMAGTGFRELASEQVSGQRFFFSRCISYKHSGGVHVDLKSCAPNLQVVDFFQRAGKLHNEQGGLEWSKIRGLLEDKLTQLERHRQTMAVKGKFLPLDVWKTKGYNTDIIEQQGEKQKSDMLPGRMHHVSGP